jgi:hypothetical protein
LRSQGEPLRRQSLRSKDEESRQAELSPSSNAAAPSPPG